MLYICTVISFFNIFHPFKINLKENRENNSRGCFDALQVEKEFSTNSRRFFFVLEEDHHDHRYYKKKKSTKKRCWWWCCLRKRKLVPLLLVQLMFLKLPISCLFSVSCVWAYAPSNNNDYNDSHINIHTLYCTFLYEDQKLHGKLHWYNILAIFLVPSFTVFLDSVLISFSTSVALNEKLKLFIKTLLLQEELGKENTTNTATPQHYTKLTSRSRKSCNRKDFSTRFHQGGGSKVEREKYFRRREIEWSGFPFPYILPTF